MCAMLMPMITATMINRTTITRSHMHQAQGQPVSQSRA
jgi:hypothetical protein